MIEVISVVSALGVKFFATFSEPAEMEHYRWTNQVLVDEKPPKDCNGVRPQVPYFDPPACGWEYGGADNEKYYWDSYKVSRRRHTEEFNRRGNVYEFQDFPQGVVGEKVLFETCLVDTRTDENEWCKRWELTKRGVREHIEK